MTRCDYVLHANKLYRNVAKSGKLFDLFCTSFVARQVAKSGVTFATSSEACFATALASVALQVVRENYLV